MPYEPHIEEENKLMVFHGSGAGSFEEAQKSMSWAYRAFDSGQVPRDFSILVFITPTTWAPNSYEAQTIAAGNRALLTRTTGAIALVTTAVGTAIPYQEVAIHSNQPQQRVRVFYDEDSARAWLTQFK
jgi:hypothetical protein